MEDKYKHEFGSILLQKGTIIYHLSSIDEEDFQKNYTFYFHPSEACIRRLNYYYICKYELLEDIELPVVFRFDRCHALTLDRKSFQLFINKRDTVNIGWMSCTPTGHGLQIFIPKPNTYFKKLDNLERIRYNYESFDTYKVYIDIFPPKIKMNYIHKSQIDAYIKYYKESNWINILTRIIDNYNIEYFNIMDISNCQLNDAL